MSIGIVPNRTIGCQCTRILEEGYAILVILLPRLAFRKGFHKRFHNKNFMPFDSKCQIKIGCAMGVRQIVGI